MYKESIISFGVLVFCMILLVKSRRKKFKKPEGKIYVIYPKSNKWICKVGLTKRDAHRRVAELNDQCYFGKSDWNVYKTYEVSDIKQAEDDCHSILLRHQLIGKKNEKEVFSLHPFIAVMKIRNTLKIYR
ncbi:GIY-YIG nuclease family protein [Vibrio campbellii]|uniref:GIY-YIG nuclease family protein n=1 Tax=Vibrio campbellii TaxID=680 RepID=UPI00131560D6|nr:GIY-YIG nuclease family protein [Vibrio campbellii]